MSRRIETFDDFEEFIDDAEGCQATFGVATTTEDICDAIETTFEVHCLDDIVVIAEGGADGDGRYRLASPQRFWDGLQRLLRGCKPAEPNATPVPFFVIDLTNTCLWL